jgi:hypothetical protein
MLIEHDLSHVAVETWLGAESAVMRGLRGLESDARVTTLEEELVLALQRYMRAVGVDLAERLTHPHR